MRPPAVSMVLVALLSQPVAQPAAAEPHATWQVHFSPGHACTEAVVRALGAAERTVYVQAYGLTSVEVARALVGAARRGVRVEVLLDRSNRRDRYSAYLFLSHAGIPVHLDERHPIAHNKVMIIDESVVVTGSFNFTRAAERNAENLLVVRDVDLAARYLANWKDHRAHAR